jgi:hypothetical protein
MPVLIAQKLDCIPVLCERCDCRAVRQDNRIEQHRRHCLKRDIDLNRVAVARRDCSEPHADEPRNCPGIAERLVNGDQLFAGTLSATNTAMRRVAIPLCPDARITTTPGRRLFRDPPAVHLLWALLQAPRASPILERRRLRALAPHLQVTTPCARVRQPSARVSTRNEMRRCYALSRRAIDCSRKAWPACNDRQIVRLYRAPCVRHSQQAPHTRQSRAPLPGTGSRRRVSSARRLSDRV